MPGTSLGTYNAGLIAIFLVQMMLCSWPLCPTLLGDSCEPADDVLDRLGRVVLRVLKIKTCASAYTLRREIDLTVS